MGYKCHNEAGIFLLRFPASKRNTSIESFAERQKSTLELFLVFSKQISVPASLPHSKTIRILP